MKNKILFIYDLPRPFIQRDLEIFQTHYHVDSLKWNWQPSARGLIFLLKTIKQIYQSDMVVVWFTLLDSVFVTLFSKLFRVKTLFFIGGHEVEAIKEVNYGSMLRPLYRLLLPFSFKYADGVVAPSYCSLIHLKRYSKSNNTHVVYHGFNPEKIRIGDKQKQAVTVAPVVLNRLKLKGILPFIHAANALPEYRFIIIGEIEKKAEQFITTRLRYNNLILTGSLPFKEVSKIFSKSTVYCQLSYHESFGCALAEAMMAGCFPVATDRGAIPEVIAGIVPLLPFYDIKATAETIDKTMKKQSFTGSVYRNHIINNFHIDMREKELLKIVNSLIKNKKEN